MNATTRNLRGHLQLHAHGLAAASAAALIVVVLGACTATGTRRAPIVEKSARPGEQLEAARTTPRPAAAPVAPVAPVTAREAREGAYVVQRGDTLYSIALAFGQDYRDIARWNSIDDPAKISVGQSLRVAAPEGDNAAGAAGVASTVPIQPVGSIESRPLASPTPLPPVSGGPSASPASSAGAAASSAAASSPSASSTGGAATPPVVASSGTVVGSGAPAAASSSAPSPQPVAPGWAGGIGKPATAGTATSPSPVAPVAPAGTASAPTAPVVSGGAAAAGSANKPADPAAEIAKAAPKPAVPQSPAAGWAWPIAGKVIEEFHETRNKGIDISGKEGDAVLAANDGQIVYSGSGLRGYGNLVIIKHTDDYISAYAHNKQIVVKQGQAVKRGQKIAEVGKSDADTPKLHFEIRRQGKPVDPLKYLPPR